MKKYTVLYAEDVPHYGTLDIEAINDEAALTLAKAHNPTTIAHDADYEHAACKRIVHIEDDSGNIVATDIALDNCYLRYGGEAERKLHDAAPELFQALQDVAAIVLWGEPILDPKLKAELAEGHEYDLETDSYNPCVDSESTALTQAVEIARETLAKLKGGDA